MFIFYSQWSVVFPFLSKDYFSSNMKNYGGFWNFWLVVVPHRVSYLIPISSPIGFLLHWNLIRAVPPSRGSAWSWFGVGTVEEDVFLFLPRVEWLLLLLHNRDIPFVMMVVWCVSIWWLFPIEFLIYFSIRSPGEFIRDWILSSSLWFSDNFWRRSPVDVSSDGSYHILYVLLEDPQLWWLRSLAHSQRQSLVPGDPV